MVEILSSLIFSFSLLYYSQHQRFLEYTADQLGTHPSDYAIFVTARVGYTLLCSPSNRSYFE